MQLAIAAIRWILVTLIMLLLLHITVVVWCSGNALVSINVVILRRARLVLGWVTFTSSNRVRTLSVFNEPSRPTQPGHPSGVG